MALVLKDRVKETTTTAGTGTVTLGGAVTGFQSFAAIGDGNTTYYTIAAQSGSEWEVGIGTYTSSGTTLARTTVLSNSSGTQPSALSFSAGTKDVFVTYPSDKSVNLDASGNATALGTPVSATLTNATGLPISSGVSGLGSNVATFLATPSSANLAAAVTDETGTGALVFATSPTLVTPALGTPSALVGTNITGTASGLTAGNVTTNANLTGAVTSTGNATVLGSFSSASLAGALTDETGTGSAVFATSPTLVTPALGTPSALVGTNITGTASGLTAGNVTTNANLTGDVTSVGNATTLTNAPVIAKVLTGYVSGAGTVAATDSILQAIQKLNGNDATNANLTGAVTSVGNATSLGSFTSSQLLGALTDETGTGAAVFATSPSLTTPTIGGGGANFSGSTSGTTNFKAAAAAGATTITMPATTGTMALTSDLPTVNNGTLTMNVSGTGLSGSQTFTANQSSAATFTVTSNATNANTASTIVARDASGNFTAGTITAALTGNASGSAATFTSTSQNSQFNSVGVGTAGSGTAGEIRATNNITAYYSDDRFKTNLGNIPDALAKVLTLNGFYYEANELAQSFGYEKILEVGVSAQQVQAVQPEVVVPAPIDENYLTVRYERLVPLLIEAIKELNAKVTALEQVVAKSTQG